MPTADYSSYHQLPGTGADGTKFDNFIDAVQATVNALDKNNLAAAAGILASQLADPTTGKVLGSSGGACAAVFPPGYEYDFAQITSNASITATTEGTANTVVTGGAVTYDGATVVEIEFFTPSLNKGTTSVSLWLYDGAASIGNIGFTNGQNSMVVKRRLTPSAAAHTYSIRASVDAGTGTVAAGLGGLGAVVPAYLKIRKV